MRLAAWGGRGRSAPLPIVCRPLGFGLLRSAWLIAPVAFSLSLSLCFAVKQIIAIVRPHLVESILGSLKRAPVEAISVVEVKGFGRQKEHLGEYRRNDFSAAFLPKVEITLYVEDSRVEELLSKLVRLAQTGRMGDGKLLVLPVTTFC